MPGKVSVLSPQSALFPTLIHTMLDEVRIDITRFYVPLEVVTTRVLVHIQRHLTDLLDKAHDGMTLRRMRQLSCVLGVETILSWLARYGTVSTQGWLRDAILHGRGGERAGPTGPLMLTAINLTGVVVEVQKRVHRAQATAPSSDPPPLVSTLSLPLEDEVGYNQYLHTVYSPRHRTTTKRFADEKAGVVPPPTAMSPRRGLHVLLSEHIYRHEYRTVSKHIPRFSSKSSVIDVADAATRRKRGVRYGNVKGKVHQ
ncbi:hypothetical protein B5M09_005223 [Aphanomyces astaci]|nr:hypothetical protein B5M09_005223 [Aphanomyces astaci]